MGWSHLPLYEFFFMCPISWRLSIVDDFVISSLKLTISFVCLTFRYDGNENVKRRHLHFFLRFRIIIRCFETLIIIAMFKMDAGVCLIIRYANVTWMCLNNFFFAPSQMILTVQFFVLFNFDSFNFESLVFHIERKRRIFHWTMPEFFCI